jgi:hypothetical protein
MLCYHYSCQAHRKIQGDVPGGSMFMFLAIFLKPRSWPCPALLLSSILTHIINLSPRWILSYDQNSWLRRDNGNMAVPPLSPSPSPQERGEDDWYKQGQ